MKGLGPNLTEKSAERISRSIGVIKELMDKTDAELEISRPSGIHYAAQETEDVLTLVKVLREAEVFKNKIGRQYLAFPGFQKDLLGKLKYSELWQWMTSKLKDWRNVPV